MPKKIIKRKVVHRKELSSDVLREFRSRYGDEFFQVIKKIHPAAYEIKKLLKKTSSSEQLTMYLFTTICYLLYPMSDDAIISVLEQEIKVLKMLKKQKQKDS